MSVAPRRIAFGAIFSALLATLTACGAGNHETDDRPEDSGSAAIGHVHGLGTDPADGTLYAATHFGVFDLGKGGTGSAVRVADRWQDTMAFTVVGPGHFVASGHPDLGEDLPVHLGLIQSTDAARTWEPVSLLGEADFHALEAAGEWLYGYDSVKGRLVVSDDREKWRTLARVPVGDLAGDPGDPTRILATTSDGLVAFPVEGGPGRALPGAPPVILIDWPSDDLLVGVTAAGILYRSHDGGASWKSSDGPPGDPQALHITGNIWYIATSGGLFRSADQGRTWKPLSA